MTGPDDGVGVEGSHLSPYLDPREFPPLSATAQVRFGACSRRGLSRTINTDHYMVIRLGRSQETLLTSVPPGLVPARFDEYGYAMVVADGVGGPEAGELASRLAVTSLVQLVLQFGKWNVRIEEDAIAHEIMARAHRFYRHVDSAVVHHGLLNTEARPETTLTAAFGAGRDLFFAHVGHSRAYLCRGGELLQLTRDHTLGEHRSSTISVAPLIDVSALAGDLKHMLTNTIGMSGPIGPRIDLERFSLDDNDRVLVCTNGLTDAVDEARLAAVLASDQSPEEQSQTLVDLATAAGTEDDATALVARYRIPSTGSTP